MPYPWLITERAVPYQLSHKIIGGEYNFGSVKVSCMQCPGTQISMVYVCNNLQGGQIMGMVIYIYRQTVIIFSSHSWVWGHLMSAQIFPSHDGL